MGKRRTKQEKLIAKLRKAQVLTVNLPKPVVIEAKERISLSTANYYVPQLDLPIDSIRSDLTKTGIVTILALLLQLALATYLNHGGWQVVNKFFRI